MRKRRFSDEQLVAIVHEAEGGGRVSEVCRRHGIARETLRRWRAKYLPATVLVFPVPAPATRRQLSSSRSTASCCSGVRPYCPPALANHGACCARFSRTYRSLRSSTIRSASARNRRASRMSRNRCGVSGRASNASAKRPSSAPAVGRHSVSARRLKYASRSSSERNARRRRRRPQPPRTPPTRARRRPPDRAEAREPGGTRRRPGGARRPNPTAAPGTRTRRRPRPTALAHPASRAPRPRPRGAQSRARRGGRTSARRDQPRPVRPAIAMPGALLARRVQRPSVSWYRCSPESRGVRVSRVRRVQRTPCRWPPRRTLQVPARRRQSAPRPVARARPARVTAPARAAR